MNRYGSTTRKDDWDVLSPFSFYLTGLVPLLFIFPIHLLKEKERKKLISFSSLSSSICHQRMNPMLHISQYIDIHKHAIIN